MLQITYRTYTSRLSLVFIITLAQLLSACGGSGGSSSIEYPAPAAVGTPQNVQAVAGDGQVTLSWELVTGAESYSVYWNTTGTVSDTENVIVVTNPLTSHSGLTNDTTYYYRIVANTPISSSALSIEVSARPQASTLGTGWRAAISGTSSNLLGITSSGSQYMTGGTNNTYLMSSDGVNWTAYSTLPLGMSFSDFSWDSTQFVSVGSSSSNGFVATSTDGLTWTPRSTQNNKPLHTIFWNGSEHIAVGVEVAVLSSDWQTSIQTQSAPSTIYGITWDGSQYLAVGDDSQVDAETILTTQDAVTWNSQTAPSGIDILNDIVYTGVVYLAVGNNGAIITSLDGTTWSTQTSGTTETLRSAAWTGNMFVVTGDNGTLLTSNDGVSWTNQTSGVTANLNDVIWTGSGLVVVGDNGTILTSGTTL